MSYRLIDANTIAESYTEVHDMPCIYADLPRGLDGGHYDMRRMDELRVENAKLREEIARARDPQRIGGQADPSSFVYAIEQLREFRWQHATNDEEAIPYTDNVADAHERENSKLRELVRELWTYAVQELLCDKNCPYGAVCDWKDCVFERRMRELGVEASE